MNFIYYLCTYILCLSNVKSLRPFLLYVGKSQSTDTSSAEIDIWQMKQQPLQPREKQPHQPQTQPQITLEATATNTTAKETSKKVPKFSRLFKLSRSPLKVIQESNRRSKSADSRSTTSTKNGGLSVVGQPQSTKVRFHKILSGEKLKIVKKKKEIIKIAS